MTTPNSSVESGADPADELALPDVGLVAKRRRRLKRVIFVTGALVAALACLRWWWGFEADRRLQAQIDQYRAAGQPVYASEFDAELDAVPDEENAAVLLERAIGAIVASAQSGVSIDDFLYEPKTMAENMDAAKELIEGNARALTLARRARERPQVAWSQRLTNPAARVTRTWHYQQRSLARLLWFSASCHYRTGDHAEAVETVHDLFAFSEAVYSHPTLVSSLAGWACYDLGLSVLEDSVAGLRISDAEPGLADGARPASRPQIEKLVRSLLDEADPHRALIRSQLGDRAGSLDLLILIDQLGSGVLRGKVAQARPLWSRVGDFALRPILVLDILRAVRFDTIAAEAASEKNWPQAAKYFPAKATSRSLLRSLTRPLTHTVLGEAQTSKRRGIQLHFKHLARRRMAASALAIRLSELDYGRRPDSLHELVQEHLSAVPLDPFVDDGTPIRYRPDPDDAVLYSVGYDGGDDGGVITIKANGRRDREHGDILFYLDGRPSTKAGATTKPSEQAGKDDDDAQDDERKGDEDQPRKQREQAR